MEDIKKFSDYTKEEGQKNYMFFKNIKNIRRMIDEISEMDESKLDDILSEHDWASDHISIATENIDQVYHFLFTEEKNDNPLPFKEEKISENKFKRTFYQNTDSSEYMWHRDREDRVIEPLEKTDWKIQFDNKIPQTIEGKIFIPKETYHRAIKGSGDLKILLTKL